MYTKRGRRNNEINNNNSFTLDSISQFNQYTMDEQFNTGLITLEHIPPNVYIAGEYTPIYSHRRSNEATDFWKNYLPVAEVQNANGFDEMNCTTRATLNCLEIDYKFQTGLNIDWSDRFVSKTSGNTKDGNFVHKPAEAIKEFGILLETEYPNKASDWNDYYKTLTEQLLNVAKVEFKDYNIDPEFIFPSNDPELLYQALMENPIGVTVRYASSADPNEILNPQGKQNHMVTIFSSKYEKYWEIFDHYEWQRGKGVIKRYDWNYPFGSALRFHLNKKIPSMYTFKQNYPYLLVEGSEQKLGMFLDGQMVIYDNKIDTLVNSASRLKRYEPPIAVTLSDWNSVTHVNGKGDKI